MSEDSNGLSGSHANGMKPVLVIVGADKGGVGKTTISRTLLDYLNSATIPARAFDSEAPRGTLYRFFPKQTEIVDVTTAAHQMRMLDTLPISDQK
jgi:MinD superfamily P-loop ATPase